VNHQSQFRVPPTPCSAPLPIRCSSGNLNPELRSAVVLPEPGAPMNTYQGRLYRLSPRGLRLSVVTASSKRSRSFAASADGRFVSRGDWLRTAPTSLSFARIARSRLSNADTIHQ